jgi:phage shock protein C
MNQSNYSKNFYRSRHGVILGVCRGVAEYLDFSIFWMRVLFLVFTFFTALWGGMMVYFIAALLMKPEPVIPFESEEDEEFYNSYTASRSMALRRLKRTYESLDKRIRRMEDIVTARDFDWDSRMR